VAQFARESIEVSREVRTDRRAPVTCTFRQVCAVLTLFTVVPGLLLAAPARADQALDAFARDVARTESVRAVKTLQHTYAQYAQYGLWNEVGALFAADATFRSHGVLVQLQTPANDKMIRDVANAIATMAPE